ncbi:MAG: DUF1858 domain-containing protein [Actinobacteria bacterium]|nr:DUF1858 domain-containing protein [Actinomycetota bacterium]
MRFTKEMSIQDALLAHPKAGEVFERFGMECLDCMASMMESVEAGASMHDLDVDALLSALNKLLEDNGEG